MALLFSAVTVTVGYSTMWMNTVNGTRRQNPRGSL